MTDAEIKALIERLRQRSHSNRMLLTDPPKPAPDADCHAAADLLVLHLATKQELSDFRQEVSDEIQSQPPAVRDYLGHFIIPAPKPDPLVEAMEEVDICAYAEIKAEYADRLRADLVDRFRTALEARGLEIREKNDD